MRLDPAPAGLAFVELGQRARGQQRRDAGVGVGEVKFSGQVSPSVKLLTYKIELKRVFLRNRVMGVGDGVMEADGRPIYEAKDLRVGLFNAKDLV